MTKIPTAEEILNKNYVHTTYHPNDYPQDIQWHDNECVFCRDYQDKVEEAMIEFVKLCAKAALEEAYNCGRFKGWTNSEDENVHKELFVKNIMSRKSIE